MAKIVSTLQVGGVFVQRTDDDRLFLHGHEIKSDSLTYEKLCTTLEQVFDEGAKYDDWEESGEAA
jgi:tRNA G46 methylase TrmB